MFKLPVQLVLFMALFTRCAYGMQLHECAIDYFEKYYILTEYNAYLCLKKHPLKHEVNYLAVPWTSLIKNSKLDLVSGQKMKGGFTICSDIHFERLFPLFKEIGIDTLFTPHAEEKKQYDGITIVPFPHYALNACSPAKKKDILYSFIGINTKDSVRGQTSKLAQLPDTIITLRPKDFKLTKKEKSEYVNVLARSRFSLCPRGTGPSTIRFWESLQAGAIPVLLADTMLLPEGFNWKSCVIRLPEKNLLQVDAIIRSISIADEEYMREQCLLAYEQFSGENFVSIIRSYYGE